MNDIVTMHDGREINFVFGFFFGFFFFRCCFVLYFAAVETTDPEVHG